MNLLVGLLQLQNSKKKEFLMKNLGSLFYKPKKYDGQVRVKRWNFWSIIGRAIRKTCTVIGAMVLIAAIISVFLVSRLTTQSAPSLPNDIILLFKIENGLTETQVKPTLMDPFPFLQPTLRHIIDALEVAKNDKRVRGLVLTLDGSSMNIAHVEELRKAVKSFRENGNFAKIYSSSFTDTSGGLTQYYLASAFDEIWMQPVGMVSISGTSMQMPFAKTALDKIGVSAQFFQREEYKSAMENLTNSEISPANQESLQSLLNSLSSKMVLEISSDRQIKGADLKSYIDKALLTGEEALQAKLIDRLDYGDVMLSELRQDATGNPDDEKVQLVDISRYAQQAHARPVSKKTVNNVALIYVVGTIVDSAGAGGNAGADEISYTIENATKDKSIEAIVLRVDSPGGSPTASETIRRSIVKAKEKGKKVIVSMGPVAASGGYWISTDADLIVADAGTITGSIGVVMGKFEGSEFFDKVGVNWQGPKYGQNADIWSLHKKFSDAENERMNILIDDAYGAFLSRVAKGRKMTIEQARNVAKGRPWTGEQALANGLVDAIGGLNDALDKTAVLIGKNNKGDLKIIKMPRELNNVERIFQLLGQEVSLGNFLSTNFKPLKTLLTQQQLLEKNGGAMVYNPELEMLR